MSSNKRIVLKIVHNDEIRIMHEVPNTWAELQAALLQMYGNSEFQVTYVDEENDHITIANNLDLAEAFNFHANKPSMKLYLKQKKALADEFEELKIEDPPEKKPNWGQQSSESKKWRCDESTEESHHRGWRCRGGRGRGDFIHKMMRGGFCKGVKKFFKQINKEKPCHKGKEFKIKVLQKLFPKKWIVSAGSSVVVGWCILNKGTQAWPEGTSIVSLAENFEILEPIKLAEVKPGENVNVTINVKIPEQHGKYKALWGIMVNGENIGMLKAKFIVSADTNQAKALTMVSMGFSMEQALQALEANNGDLDLAISNILKN